MRPKCSRICTSPDVFLRAGQRHPFLLDQVVNEFEVLDILRREQTVPFGILAGLEHGETFFPETDQGRVHVEHLGHFAHAEKHLPGSFLFVGHTCVFVWRFGPPR